MRQETEMLFEHIFREDRSLLELLDCNYTFLNEALAKYYGMHGIEGPQMRLVTLPEGSPRGGVLTQGTYLTVTSNPDRTSPVKRGLFILENILGTPPAPLRRTFRPWKSRFESGPDERPRCGNLWKSTARTPCAAPATIEWTRWDWPSRTSTRCPCGADTESGQPVEATGTLTTGETFHSVQELKKILVTTRRTEFYRCLTEKMLTYALGRGLEYYDVGTVDTIVDQLEQNGGRASLLVKGIIESAPFQKRRRSENMELTGGPQPLIPASDQHPDSTQGNSQ